MLQLTLQNRPHKLNMINDFVYVMSFKFHWKLNVQVYSLQHNLYDHSRQLLLLSAVLLLTMKGGRRQKKEKGGEADINLIIQAFSKCRRKNGTISTDHYLCACNELVW